MININTARKIILYLYAALITILGVIFIPSYLMYGRGENAAIISSEYVPIWKLINKGFIINDSFARYEVNIYRQTYTIVILTIIIAAIYLAMHDKKKSKDASHDV